MNFSFNIKFHPESFHDTPLQHHQTLKYEFNFLYRWHSMVPDKLTIDNEVYEFEKIQFKPNIVKKGIPQLLSGNS
jgi:hypothetical protein